jgi:N-carbamoylputrescine amidase
MDKDNARTLSVAAVQMESKNGLIKLNLEHALPFVEDAAKLGAKIIVLPEFMPTGYIFTKAIWDAGEPREGLTVKWLKEHSKRLGVYLGTSFLEADGDDFFNTFVITTPDGSVAGRVRKQTPAAFEAYFTKGDTGSHVINTEFGKIGVGICYENMLSYIPSLMSIHSVDILLMPHSAPSPMKSILTPQNAVNAFHRHLKELAVTYAKQLGIPAIMINKSGKWETPLPGIPFLKQVSSFPGFTSIADSDGKLKAQLGGEEAVIVEDVILDASRKTKSQFECKGRWTGDFPWGIKIWRQVEVMGGIGYCLSSERKRRARRISSNTQGSNY